MASSTTNGYNLPEDLMTNILVRLPVKSLLRLRAVSNPWLSLISSPSFIDSHLRCAVRKTDDNLILEEEDINSVSLLRLTSNEIHGIDLKLPYSKGESSFVPRLWLVGSCNGIVCVAFSNCSDDLEFYSDSTEFSKLFNRDIYLWNPATKQSKLISPHTKRTNTTLAYHGFGFDSIANEFKVVRVVRVRSSNDNFAEVYSANDNVWRAVEPCPVDFPVDSVFDVCVKGVLCCLGKDGLMAFNLNEEKFICGIKLPNVRHYHPRITKFKDSVALIDYSKDKESNSKITLWRLDDACLRDGTAGSWTLIFSFDVSFAVDFVSYLNSGNILLISGEYGGWSLYNPDKKECKLVQVPRHGGEIFKYTESLVSIKGSKQVRCNAHEDDNQ